MTERDIMNMENMKQALMWFLRGNEDAVRFCLTAYAFAQLWDDVVDSDKPPRDVDEFNRITLMMLTECLCNPFVTAHAGNISACFLSIFLRWQDANKLEKTGAERDLHLAWANKFSLVDLFHVCAFFVGGPQWAMEHGPQFRRILDESYHDLVKEKYDA